MSKKSKKKKNYKSIDRSKPAEKKAEAKGTEAKETKAKDTPETKGKDGFLKKYAKAYLEKEKDEKYEPRRPFNVLATMETVSIAFLLFLVIAALIMGEKESIWALFLFIGLNLVPCLTFWELSYSTLIFGYDLRSKPVPEGVRPIRRGFHIAALVFTNLCAFFVVPGIAVIWVELYFGALIFGLLAFGLPAGYCWFKTFEYRLLKKSYQKYLKKTEEKKTKKK